MTHTVSFTNAFDLLLLIIHLLREVLDPRSSKTYEIRRYGLDAKDRRDMVWKKLFGRAEK